MAEFNLFRSVDVRVGETKVIGGPKRLDGINSLCAHIPDEQSNTTVYELTCAPGPIKGNLEEKKRIGQKALHKTGQLFTKNYDICQKICNIICPSFFAKLCQKRIK